MGDVVSLEEFRRRREPPADPHQVAVRRLDRAVEALDPLVRSRGDRVNPTVERELRAIAHAVSAGLPRDAADRAERLIGLLAHPAASG